MAQIDIRNAVVRIKDGYAGPGGTATINAPAYAIGALTMLVDSFVGALANGNLFTVAGDTTIYTVTAHSETLGNTTSVTFTPGLVVAADNNAVVSAYQPNVDTIDVNNGPGYTAGQSVIAVDGFTGTIVTGGKIKFAGHATLYNITAHSETLGNTTGITISPVLTAGIANNEVATLYDLNADTLLVNLIGTYIVGTSTIRVTGFSGALVDYDYFTIGSNVTRYAVASHIETLGNTTSITFTPPLVDVATTADSVTIIAHQLEVTIGDGTCTYDEKRAFKYIRNRNRLDTVRQEMDEPIDVSIDATWEFLRSDSGEPPTIEDALKNRGQASGWITSADDVCEPYAVDIEIEYDPPCSGEKRELIIIEDFRYESLGHDLKQGVLAVKGKANVTEATVSRVT